MAAPHNGDVDSSTEEGTEAVRRSQAALDPAIKLLMPQPRQPYGGQQQQQQQQLQQQQQRQPAWNGTTDKLQPLYIKARDHQDQLTDEERHLLVSRGDIVGRVLGAPDSLTPAEIHDFMGLPAPDVVRANIQRVTGGALGTIAELNAKVTDAVARGRFDELVSTDEVLLIKARYQPDQFNRPHYSAAIFARFGVPGNEEAADLVATRLGFRDVAANAALEERYRPYRPPPPMPARHLGFLRHLASMSQIDREDGGVYMWPETAEPRSPHDLFCEDAGLGAAHDVAEAWANIAEQDREAYRARSAELRRESWAAFEAFLAGRARRVPTPEEVQGKPSFPPGRVTAFEVFRDGLEPGLGFGDVLRKWEGLEESERRGYAEKAAPLNAAGQIQE